MAHSPRFLDLVNDAKSRVREVDLATILAWREAGQAFTLLDVREESEWAEDRIPGAVYLGRGILERDVEATCPDPDARLVLYCGGGFRSALAGDSLQRMGYGDVWSLAGGIKAWWAHSGR
jgi:rhodanese-related sulfurtransferase